MSFLIRRLNCYSHSKQLRVPVFLPLKKMKNAPVTGQSMFYYLRNSSTNPSVPIYEGTREEYMKFLSTTERTVFFSVFLFIFIVAFFGNVAAIVATAKRKHRYIQKTFIISLALSDLIMAIAYAINHLESFSHPLINWTLGSFMCSFIPLLQIFGVIASSAALVGIALDRFRNVVHSTRNRWNPNIWLCLIGFAVAWIASAGLSYPIYRLFELKGLRVVFYDESGLIPLYSQTMYMCMSFLKEQLMIYYICVSITIFIPLLVIFMWLYCNIAKLVWTHRKPLSYKFQKKRENPTETSETSKADENNAPKQKKIKPIISKHKSVHVERKIRTFKIIIFLMLAFFFCRIPYWTFNITKLTGVYNEHKHWIMTYVFNGMGLLNCALNPFLYTFLNGTIDKLTKVYKALDDFMCSVCCCCISNREFDDFEKENPFVVENFEKKRTSRIGSPHPNRTMPRNSRVKFEDVAVVQTCSQVVKTSQECYKDVKKY